MVHEPSYSQNWELGHGTSVVTDGVSETVLARISITSGSNCSIDLSGLATLNTSLQIFMSDGCHLILGEGMMVNGALRLFMHEPSSITIGSHCLFGGGDVWTSDMHSILDKDTGERLNPAESIVIDDRVWLGAEVLILGGSRVGRDSVVAARSLVTGKTFPDNSVIGGQPAKVLRSNVVWDIRIR
ncbi:transferase hexapeptide (six repeat-containing protein) [Cryobacterium levicorallinum]|uniref:Transferase hexapeptide (Six repeat-containing protein) n=1 Tax=Cryobacterium levicorallinum TaxID=995038 RepID=A0ABY1EI05_9MICO|nr:transferase hexapeptide (six repeat-containing protein) [Cryobacterium levicorallinum]